MIGCSLNLKDFFFKFETVSYFQLLSSDLPNISSFVVIIGFNVSIPSKTFCWLVQIYLKKLTSFSLSLTWSLGLSTSSTWSPILAPPASRILPCTTKHSTGKTSTAIYAQTCSAAVGPGEAPHACRSPCREVPTPTTPRPSSREVDHITLWGRYRTTELDFTRKFRRAKPSTLSSIILESYDRPEWELMSGRCLIYIIMAQAQNLRSFVTTQKSCQPNTPSDFSYGWIRLKNQMLSLTVLQSSVHCCARLDWWRRAKPRHGQALRGINQHQYIGHCW